MQIPSASAPTGKKSRITTAYPKQILVCSRGYAVHNRAVEILGALNRGFIPGSADRDSGATPTFKIIALPWVTTNTLYWWMFDSSMKNATYGLQLKESQPTQLEGPNIVFKVIKLLKLENHMEFWKYSPHTKKGYKKSKTHKQKISVALKDNKNMYGRAKNNWKWSEEARRKRSKQWKGKTWSPNTQFKKGVAPWNKGKKMPESTRKKLSITASQRIGEKAANWRGENVGYHGQHIRIRKRYGKADHCALCGKTEGKFQWAHIPGPGKKRPWKGSQWIRLCVSCHKRFDLAVNKARGIEEVRGAVFKLISSIASPDEIKKILE